MAKELRPEHSVQSSTAAYLQLILFPWLTFVTTLCLFALVFFHTTFVPWMFLVLGILFGLFLMSRKQERDYYWPKQLGFLVIIAAVFGANIGIEDYNDNISVYYGFFFRHVYTNVLASEPAIVHDDAGALLFHQSAVVDTGRSRGYMANGQVFCVAPVLDGSMMARVQYWAAGKNCCGERGNFNCDASRDVTAKQGVVIHESDAVSRMFTNTDREYFQKAVKLALADYDLASTSKPMFVRWVKDVDVVRDGAWSSGAGVVVVAVSIYLLWSIFIGFGMHMFAKRSMEQQLLFPD